MEIDFTYSDVWLLLAVAQAEREAQRPRRRRSTVPQADGATLASIYGWCDAINHSVFTPQELRRGFAKLYSAGYVVDYGGRFGVTDAGRALLSRAGYPEASPWQAWPRIESLMNAAADRPRLATFEDPAWPYPSITDAVAKEAEAEYREWFDAKERRRRGER